MKYLNIKNIGIGLVLVTALSLLAIYSNSLQQDSFIEKEGYYVVTQKSEQGGWIYNIYHSQQLLIKQEYVPALDGKFQFSTQKDAEKAGRKVMERLSKGHNPSLSPKDFNENNIQLVKVP